VPLPADGREATALPGLRAAPTDVALADAGWTLTNATQPVCSDVDKLTATSYIVSCVNNI